LRDLAAPNQKGLIKELLQGVFIAELIKPSKRLWFGSAWVSDIDILDNSSRQFNKLNPDWPVRHIRLSEVLSTLVQRGGEVVIILRDVPHNKSFEERIKAMCEGGSGKLSVLVEPDFHEKGILGDDYLISGSMNFTYNGIHVNDEHIVYRCDPPSIAERQLVLEEKWGGKLDC